MLQWTSRRLIKSVTTFTNFSDSCGMNALKSIAVLIAMHVGASPAIARLAMFMLLTTATLTTQRRQVYLMIDEFQQVAAHNLDTILQIARSMNVGVILANQSMLDLKQENLIHVVEANCRYRQWYAISSPEEQERLSKGSGETVELCPRPLCPRNAMDSIRGRRSVIRATKSSLPG